MDEKKVDQIKIKITECVNRVDPWHLIEIGVPADEYNSQIDRIVSLAINKRPNKEALVSELLGIFKTKEFELEQDKINELADAIGSCTNKEVPA
ncbi:MAG: hypothetical protein A3C84_02715 [Candidatus Ryanbacteria bacterium RIFCSPHIGHO2_02_FULL_48_12]|uniref:Uncharacterized protein n=1 Tax=Candidatus Ryanbacteria bacterium RIFCSPHIGHO2_01_FULL_48_27 TaxID=1802115 RepID=A0A1G2G5K6_9BACT|nr:MAG: hypothetical protein A2756_01190 [Candidatus Ryanbacteria bacterium RIFCSPHIGHO2_01_FULL_48_27]OGZ49018.1 MAG: hypothetical protein A3C84_02715 [Candidatus Ryanbacteria bacterium RIFCSPHIGHO2_02_FULL_48_12]